MDNNKIINLLLRNPERLNLSTVRDSIDLYDLYLIYNKIDQRNHELANYINENFLRPMMIDYISDLLHGDYLYYSSSPIEFQSVTYRYYSYLHDLLMDKLSPINFSLSDKENIILNVLANGSDYVSYFFNLDDSNLYNVALYNISGLISPIQW